MKAVVLHEYGSTGKLKYEDFPDPKPGPGEVLVEVMAISINPIDWKMRSGEAKERFPLTLPAILGRDLAGSIKELGEGVKDFKVGEAVFALAWATYAQLCIVKASDLARIPAPKGDHVLGMTTAATLPLVAVTGDQLIHIGARAEKGQTILLTGALGSVGRVALYCALEMGVKVIAGVRKKQIDEALKLGATAAIDLGDEDVLASLGFVDAVGDTIGGALGNTLLAKVKPGGNFGSVVGPPKDAALHPLVQVNAFMAHPDAATITHYGEAVRDGKLVIPVDRIIPLRDAGEGQAAAEKGGIGKVVLTT
ncbi:NADP-dependent oxidoreductase [Granulicella paludicola]|uniref:NADP-dependent oxidoreductase n=1 Tax=Granulicella paludicola TaxID=474951 RepID=UPI0021E0F81D|nr:NADP-dependent oxidoreductase [Granulicella paludicola]